MKPVAPLLPEHDGLRRAVRWLAAQTPWDAKLIEEGSRGFDLPPIDEDFLLRRFCRADHDSEDGRSPETGCQLPGQPVDEPSGRRRPI